MNEAVFKYVHNPYYNPLACELFRMVTGYEQVWHKAGQLFQVRDFPALVDMYINRAHQLPKKEVASRAFT